MSNESSYSAADVLENLSKKLATKAN